METLSDALPASCASAQGVALSGGVALQGDAALPNDIALPDGLTLRRTEHGLALSDGTMELCGDFSAMAARLRPDKLSRELLVRAAKIKGAAAPVAIDATAGLGEDALLLAAAGFTVQLFEQDPVIFALLEDAFARAAATPELAPIASRMHATRENSVNALQSLASRPDVVYLDPMFPERTKSAAVKKKFQLLHHLEAPCENAEELLSAALLARPRKVVIKRPAKGPYLAGKKPSYSLTGKAIRYDVIALAE